MTGGVFAFYITYKRIYTLSDLSALREMSDTLIYAATLIKGFHRVRKMTMKLIMHLITVMPPYYPCPVFYPSLISPMKTHKSRKYTPRPGNTPYMGGYPLTILTRLKLKFLLTFQFPNPQLRCQKITRRSGVASSPPALFPL